jgi:hypothetical protein
MPLSISHASLSIRSMIQLIFLVIFTNNLRVYATTAFSVSRNEHATPGLFQLRGRTNPPTARIVHSELDADQIMFPLDEDLNLHDHVSTNSWLPDSPAHHLQSSAIPVRFMNQLSAGNDWSDSDTDLEDFIHRLSHASDPESVDGNVNRRLSPSLMKTIESWDFAIDHVSKISQKHSPPPEAQGAVLSRSDLYRLRMLQAPPTKGQSSQGMARSLPSSTSSHILENWSHGGIGELLSEGFISRGPGAAGHNSPRRFVGASTFRGYLSDGES